MANFITKHFKDKAIAKEKEETLRNACVVAAGICSRRTVFYSDSKIDARSVAFDALQIVLELESKIY